MDLLDPTETMDRLKENTVEAIKPFFPYEGKVNKLVATNIYVGADTDVDDIATQKQARLRGRTWSTGVYGDFDLINKETGKKVDSVKGMKLVNLPQITRRYSFIIEGNERQADNQWRLKAGVYSRKKDNGDLEAQFNLAEGRGFRMGFYPQKRQFLLTYGTTNIQLIPALRALGHSDDSLRQKFGADVFDQLKGAKARGDIQKMAKAVDYKFQGGSDEEAAKVVRAALDKTVLRGDTTKITLGEPHEKVTTDTLVAAAKKLIDINKGTATVDNRDSLRFKELWTIDEHIPERIANSKQRITFKIKNNIDRKESVRDIVSMDIFNVPVKSFFTQTSLAQQTNQTNPIDMISGFLRTTIMGSGGIGSEQAVTMNAKMLDPSMLGVVDPIHTPEGNPGISNHLTIGLNKRGKEPLVFIFDNKKKTYGYKTPTELAAGTVGFSDQYERDSAGKFVPAGSLIAALPKGGGDPVLLKPSEVDFVLGSTKSMFSMAANLIPFLPSDQGNRAGMGVRHMEQTVALKDREVPLVQSATGLTNDEDDTFEKSMGKLAAHRSPATGKVISVSDDAIIVQGADKKKHTVHLYNNFPLNEKKSYVTSSPLVKVGDDVSEGDVVADTSHTKNGVLAIGTNIRLAYHDFAGLTFEDSQVLSESAAKKLTSVHMTKPRAFLDRGMSVDLKKFRAQFPGVITDDNAKKLDDDGVIKKGQTVNPGDVIMSVLKKTEPSPEQVMLKGIHKALARPYKNAAVTWDSDFSGTVTDVVRNGNEITAYVTTEEPAQVGDKFSMRHGGKGTVSAILPDEEMPVDKDGNHVEMIVSPSGVPGRVNPGQVLENMLGKVAKKTGTTYAVDNFQSNGRTRIVQVKGHFRTVKGEDGTIKRTWVDPHTREVGYHELVKQALAKHKVSETDELFDPKTGKSFGQILNGYTYILKLQHQVEKGLAARSHGAGNAYDVNMAPKGGGDTSAQTFGELGLYSLLSHGATGVVSESLNYKSDRGNQDVWTAIQAGEPIPAPKTPFVYDKFVAYLNAIGIDVKKEGNNLHLVPFTDKAIKEKSTGELSDPTKMIRGKDLSPEVGGLFDPKRTGGPGGKLWSSFALAEPVPNPVFEKPIRSLLGLTAVQYEAILKGEQAINGKTGPEGIAAALKSINVDKELEKEKGNLKTARRGALDLAYKKVKYLQSLKDLKLRADEAYVLTSIPVVPPMFRPIMVMEGGDLNTDGLNLLYKNIALVNNQLKEGKDVLPDSALYNLRSSLYAEVESLVGNKAAETVMEGGEKKPPGILTILAGTQPKHSYIHEKLMSRRQDLSGRAVITLDQSLGLDQIGIPREAAFELYRPFIVKELVQQGYTPLSAREEIAKRTSLANRALEVASAKRPVLFKRDPVLHKFGIMGFDVKLHDGKSITINPSITGGFNADFDGDKMGVFVPVTDQAVREVQGMKPSKNMFNTPMDEVMYQPSLGGQLGLYLISLTGRDTGKKFSSEKDALAAMEKGDLRATDLITVGGKKTTPGRLAVYATVPASVRNEAWLTDPEFTLGKKNLQKVFRAVALKSPEEFGPFVTRITAVGFNHVHSTGFSYAAKDFDTLSELRDNVLKIADKEVEKVRASGTLSAKQKDDAAVRIYTDATKEMNARAVKILDTTGNKLRMMNNAGVKPSWEQVQQLILAPMLLTNAQGRVIPAPVRNSYSEGLDGAGYWTASSGARKGLVDKVLSVRDPGALSKQIMNTAVPYAITVEDCGTDKGIMLDAADANLLDRFTAKDIAVGGQTYKAGTELSPNFIDKLRQAKVAKVLARSPLKCQAPHGLCSRCFGVMPGGKLPSIGTNIGVISGQAIGERGTQLSMKAFHLGGLAGSDSKVTSALGRVTQLLKMPETLPDAATLAATSGKVSSMTKSPLGGFDVRIGDEDHYIPGGREPKVKVGDQVEKGDMLSDGSIDPRELLDLTNMDRVQRYMSDELYSAYAGERIKRRNSEVVVKAMTNLAKIDDPGDSDEFVRGDPVSLAYVEHLNRTKGYKNPIQFTPWLRGLETLPLDRTTDWGQRLQYRHLKETFTRGAGEGWKSDIHGGFMPAALFGNEFGKSPDLSKSPY